MPVRAAGVNAHARSVGNAKYIDSVGGVRSIRIRCMVVVIAVRISSIWPGALLFRVVLLCAVQVRTTLPCLS